ncbi:MAG TPA: hypothetical protein VHW74_13995 [Mycobacteriales bacterium]|nr:hypothetical protein [Mycobacteriales bacterium]
MPPGVEYVSSEAVEAWLRDLGAVDYERTTVRLFLRGRGHREVHVVVVRTKILERRPPIRDTWACSPPQGDETATLLLFDLDQDEPTAWEGRLNGSRELVGTEPYFDTHRLYLHDDETKEYRVEATTQTNLVHWQLEVDYLVGKQRRQTLTVHPPGGGWFKTTGGDLRDFTDHWWAGPALLGRHAAIRPASYNEQGDPY